MLVTPIKYVIGKYIGTHSHGSHPLVLINGGQLAMLNSIRAPYAHLGIRFVPLGGVNADNMTSWLRNPGVFAVGGSWLTPKDAIQSRNWDEITRRATEARRIADAKNES